MTNPQFPADLVTFTREILDGKLHSLYSEYKDKDNHNGKKNEKSSKERKQNQETKETSTDQNTRDRKEKPKIFIMGYSMMKKSNGYLLAKKNKHTGTVRVRSFTTANASCMQDHVKPTIRDINPQQIILYVGTNE